MSTSSGRQIGVEIILPVLLGILVIGSLAISSQMEAKWFTFTALSIFALSAALVIKERERFFLYSALFFYLYA
jgi:hypothetical protein